MVAPQPGGHTTPRAHRRCPRPGPGPAHGAAAAPRSRPRPRPGRHCAAPPPPRQRGTAEPGGPTARGARGALPAAIPPPPPGPSHPSPRCPPPPGARCRGRPRSPPHSPPPQPPPRSRARRGTPRRILGPGPGCDREAAGPGGTNRAPQGEAGRATASPSHGTRPRGHPTRGAEAPPQDALPPPAGGLVGRVRRESAQSDPSAPPPAAVVSPWAVALQLGGAPRIQGYPAVATATTSRPRIWGG
ncbi:proline-rich proteoglycan 2-like [Molothrus ater]|uniref:proline-rich proteoglycan 2-like n=1 Tax=Molothrus ater TaxID=84834 RepID=UPI00174874F3|nr:proline-rich proteoglycan 2-like [Molothrus ater]